jgi:hypothetical protein
MSTTADAAKSSTHYQLLRLKPFESDQAVIRSNFRKLVEQIRAKIVAEPTVARWPAMLADMTGAMLVLCDARRKADYDLSLGNTASRDARPMDLEKILRARKALDDLQLDRAKKFADTVNIDLHDAVVQQKLLTPEAVMPLYADSLGLPFVNLSDLTIDHGLIATVPAIMARQHSLTPVLRDGKTVIVASPNPLRPEIEEQLRLRYDAPISQVICTKAAVDAAIAEHYPREAAMAQMSTTPMAAPKKGSSGGKDEPAAAGAPRINRAELRKKKLKIGFVCGAFTTMLVVFGLSLFTDYGMTNPIMLPILGIGVGSIAFAIGYLVVNE